MGLKMTTKSIYSLEVGESTALCNDDKEWKEVQHLNRDKFSVGSHRIDGVIITRIK